MLREALVGMLSGVPSTFSKADAEALVRTYLATFTSKDMAARAALFAKDAVVEDPVGLPAHDGIEALKAFWGPTDEGPAQFTSELHRIVHGGNEFVANFTVTMSLPGMGGIAIEGFSTYRVNDAGKIVRMRAFWDEECLK
ncbi:MAG: nuclear transport factor 2 family protein [Zavarzinia sp.]|nr:nuclear transport factor 2 family protein [Zavarzinia sp.]